MIINKSEIDGKNEAIVGRLRQERQIHICVPLIDCYLVYASLRVLTY